jgi:hypothetical protein
MWESPSCDTSNVSPIEDFDVVPGALVARLVENIVGTADFDDLPLLKESKPLCHPEGLLRLMSHDDDRILLA